jgi:hypothetical protein
MRGYLKDHVGVFEPDEVVTLLAAFDKSWGLFKPAASDTRQTSSNRRGPAARRCSTRLGSFKSAKRAGEQTQLAERRRKRSSGDPALPGAYALMGSSCRTFREEPSGACMCFPSGALLLT